MLENVVAELQRRKQSISAQIKSLETESRKLEMAISTLAGLSVKAVAKPVRKRRMSAAGRRAIAAAARARWAKIRAAKAGAPAKKKRRLSAKGRKAIIAAIKARWARVRVRAEQAKA